MLYVSLICLIVSFTAITGTPDYYWRPFDGTIPTDAFVASSDGSQNTYVGNVPVWGGGLFIGQLYPGVREIQVTGHSQTDDGIIHTRTEDIQILCTRSPELFEWTPATPRTLHEIPYQLVQGGYEYLEMGVLYVGRVDFNGWKIGKVCGYQFDDADMLYIPDGENEHPFGNFQVLVYKGLKKDEKDEMKRKTHF